LADEEDITDDRAATDDGWAHLRAKTAGAQAPDMGVEKTLAALLVADRRHVNNKICFSTDTKGD
jgi:hypothetical protein